MLIRSLTEVASTLYELHEDDVLDVDERLAAEFIEKGWAEPVAAETASFLPPEAAARQPARIRKAKQRT